MSKRQFFTGDFLNMVKYKPFTYIFAWSPLQSDALDVVDVVARSAVSDGHVAE